MVFTKAPSGDFQDLATDTHLAKKYNDALFDCIMKCNTASLILKSQPHYDSLRAYISAVDTFFINTYFLFENIQMGEKTLTWMLIDKMKHINYESDEMKYTQTNTAPDKFKKVSDDCRDVHMMIMYGLQSRKMLVRMSEREPRGQDTINYWDTKTGFKKGNIPWKVNANGL